MPDTECTYVTIKGIVFRLEPSRVDNKLSDPKQRDVVHNLFYVKRGLKQDPIRLPVAVVILLATHASYFLTQFDISRIAVLRKENGEVKFIKPQDSKTLTENLKDFGPEEIEIMHRSDELEWLA